MEDTDIHFFEAVTNIRKTSDSLSYVFIGTNSNPSPIINTSWLESITLNDQVYGIEPFSKAYAKCLTFFSEFPNIKAKVINSAISDKNGTAKLYQGVKDWENENITGIHGTLIYPKNSLGEYKNEMYVDVSTITFEYFVWLLDIKKINVLVIDVEGYEHEILRQCLSLGFLPEIIYYEEFNMLKDQKDKCIELLGKYNITRCKYDNLCLLK